MTLVIKKIAFFTFPLLFSIQKLIMSIQNRVLKPIKLVSINFEAQNKHIKLQLTCKNHPKKQ
uniref:Putative ovule protein n=1 Tax=Solanum chacoense TaxID=4108 RepID=A0A0V0GVB2_SOLCH